MACFACCDLPIDSIYAAGNASQSHCCLYLARSTSVMACLNAATPLELPWTNITITADNRAISRGIPIALGNPPQVLSLRPWLGGNDTSVFNSGDCGASNDTCIGLKGGVYSPAKSTTYLRSPYTSWNGTHGRETASGSQIFFNDELQLTFETTAFGFPAYMDEYGKGSSPASCL